MLFKGMDEPCHFGRGNRLLIPREGVNAPIIFKVIGVRISEEVGYIVFYNWSQIYTPVFEYTSIFPGIFSYENCNTTIKKYSY
jgi:hypothetical protein